MSLLRSLTGAVLILTASTFSHANPYKIDDALDRQIHLGLYELYCLNFARAADILNSLQDRASEHPMVALALTTLHWWRISVEVLETDETESRPFLEAADNCIKISQAKIKVGDPTGEAHLTLGSTYALLARWEAANQNWFSVLDREKKARRNLTKALEINPEIADAYMALGIFDYIFSRLSGFTRFIAGSDAGSDPQRGLEELHIAAERGIYQRPSAIFLLASLYSDALKEPRKSVELLSTLRQEYPASPFIDLMMITAFFNDGCLGEMQIEGNEFEKRLESGVYNKEFTAELQFIRGLTFFRSRDWKKAEEHFDLAIKASLEKSPYKVWATLYQGYARDAQGNREGALKNYHWLLGQPARWKSHEYSKKRLKKPFVITDPEATTLLL